MAKLVRVKDIPVRYNNVTHQPGEEFEMEEAHVNPAIVDVVGDVANGANQNSDDDRFKDMSVEELKAYADTNGIDIGKSTSVDGIIKKIIAAEEEQKQEGNKE